MDLDLNNLTGIRVLGHGATGTVFLVTNRTSPSHPPFALKVIQKQNLDSNSGRARSELSVLSLLLSHPHPFLPSLLASLETPSFLSFALPFCPAGDLNSLRHSLPDKIFSPASIRFYLSELISALSHLHSLGIAYRDLKPENILLQSNGHILLTDFDLSRFLQRFKKLPKSATRVSPMNRQRSYSFVGTDEYVAPEVVRGDGHDFAVDWWALGILAYEMAYGRTPFRGRNRKETMRNVVARPPEFVGKQCAELIDLIKRLLAKEPERRLGYASGAEEVKRHRFFDGLKWDLIAEVCRPPFLATAEEIEEEEMVRCHKDGFDVRDYFKKMRIGEAAVEGSSPARVSSFAEF
ncbi:hypothetical protein M5K25_013385 [Dendrobium thyrsiflorum]|uniref:non-specific serine/threonine protein kinase n=1 Tax=Dendrobium thyrsiflorum TaxID=117978 RepID=A0ABD0USQ9_DENTH